MCSISYASSLIHHHHHHYHHPISSIPWKSIAFQFQQRRLRSVSLSKSTSLRSVGGLRIVSAKSSKEEAGAGGEVSSFGEDEWLTRLPDKTKPFYSHSLPCIEAWLRVLGFYQSKEDPALWFIEKPQWQAQLSLDVTDLFIRYLKSGPGNLEKDVERRFSYALSREDIENAILGGP